MKRFIIVVIDSMGIGEMEDVKEIRPQDLGSNTLLHLLEQHKKFEINIDQLIDLGVMNAMGLSHNGFSFSDKAVFGSSNLKHYGADSYFGHQEISGTNPKKPIFHTLSDYIDEIEASIASAGFEVKRVEKDGLELLKVNELIFVGDNMETDLGQAINVVGDLDHAGMEMIKQVGHIVRQIVKVPRVIAFGGSNVSIDDITSAIITSDSKFIGIDAPASGVYKENYHVEHIGYGVDSKKQVPYALSKINIKNYFYGKVSNIVENPNGDNYDVVDTEKTFEYLVEDLKKERTGFYFLNVQETDLAGHAEDSQRYIDRLNVTNLGLKKVRELLKHDDILVVMADHGNDPTIGHSKHTRERVPLLIDYINKEGLIDIGLRDTMADVGQTVAAYFGTEIEYGTSFLNLLK